MSDLVWMANSAVTTALTQVPADAYASYWSLHGWTQVDPPGGLPGSGGTTWLSRTANLGDVPDPAAARANLGITGGGGSVSFGTTAGTATEGNDSRVVGAAQRSANLSDLASAAAARTNLGLGTAAVAAASAFQAADSDLATIAALAPTGGTVIQESGGAWAARTPAQVAATLPADQAAGTASLRTLGMGAQQAASGSDSRITGAVQGSTLGAASGVATLDSSTRVVQPASDLSAFGIYSVLGKGSTVAGDGTTDDTSALNTFIASTPAGATIYVPGGRTYLVSGMIRLLGNRRYLGGGWALAGSSGGAVIKLKSGTNLAATGGSLAGILVSDKWFTNQTSNDDPIEIANIAIDGNKANNASSTACGIVLCGYWSRVERCYIANTPKHGLHLTDVGQNGSTQISNSASENRIADNKINNAGGHGISQICANTISNQDGFCHHNLISNTGQSGINYQRGSGWDFRRNHMYGIGDHGMELANCFATEVVSNEVEDFGNNNVAAAYYHGIAVTQLNSRGTTVAHNFVGCTEPAVNASTYQYIVVQAGSSQMDANAVIEGNRVHGPASPTAQGIGIVLQVVSGGGNQLITTCQGNRIANVTTPSYVGSSVTLAPLNLGMTLASLSDITGASSAAAGTALVSNGPGSGFSFAAGISASDPPGYGIPANYPLPLTLGASASTHGVANEARYSRVCGGATISKIRTRISVASGNVCVAVYNNTGSGLSASPANRQATSGSVACPAAGDADISLGASVAVSHGMWYGFNADNTTISLYGWNGPSSSSLMSGQAYTAGSAFPLPSTASGLTANGFRQPLLVGVP
ncbi:right-handed parallel beta-helix repeat-containing protein [Frankia sp. AvcI1]|uniref:right-handed parallel beta-helix repeat-containing protein n=1 Tax=Frankia sp. AvcI1 TaxID=573496 RepID=UPI0021186A63|nr:right-handed parallel beta-helix repeat-containing protein [Frankia sp. AvcI1]